MIPTRKAGLSALLACSILAASWIAWEIGRPTAWPPLLPAMLATFLVAVALVCAEALRPHVAARDLPIALAGAAAAAALAFIVAPTLPSSGASPPVIVAATGDRNVRALGAEVWLLDIVRAGARLNETDAVALDGGWEWRDGVALSYLDQPARLDIVGAAEVPLSLTFLQHQYSGVVEIRAYGSTTRLDLWSAEPSYVTLLVLAGGVAARISAAIAAATGWLVVALAAARLAPGGRRLAACFLPLLPLAAVAVASAPGIYTPDSYDQLEQALTGRFHDWHPPIMSALWAGAIELTGTPASLLWLHLGVLALGILAWSATLVRWGAPGGAHLLLLGLSLPCVFGFWGVLWKDVGLVVALLTATGFAALASTMERRARLVLVPAACVLLFYAMHVRSNALPALLPIALVLIKDRVQARPLLTMTLTFLCIVIAYLATSKTIRPILDADHRYPSQYIMLYDLAGIAQRTSLVRIPESFRSDTYSIEHVLDAYRTYSGNHLFFQTDERKAPPLIFREDNQDELRAAWIEGIISFPAAYLKHRVDAFWMLLSSPAIINAFPIISDDPRLGAPLPGREWAAARLGEAVVATSIHTPLYTGWFWACVLVAVTVVGLARFRRHDAYKVGAALGASGLLYLAPYALVSPATDFRYIYWCVVAGVLGAVALTGASLRDALDARRERAITRAAFGPEHDAASRSPPLGSQPRPPVSARGSSVQALTEMRRFAP